MSSTFAKNEKEPFRYYYADAAVVSLDPNQPLSSYQSHGRGSGAPGSTLGYSTPSTQISIALTVESNRFYADVALKPTDKTGGGEAKKQRVELTDLRPTSIDVGKDKNGRTYQLNLTPSIKTVRVDLKPFREAADDLYRLQFHGSRVLLNDRQFIGQMLASDAEKFSMDICGVAYIEFSLQHLKDAKPWGQLQNGQITLSHPNGTSIEIANVTNGAEDRLVPGGPYVVWVRWSGPRETAEEFRATLKAERDQLMSKAGGSDDTTAQAVKVIDQQLAREPGPWVTSSGAGGLLKQELDRDE